MIDTENLKKAVIPLKSTSGNMFNSPVIMD